MQQLVECVPNFSNGREPEIYNGIADTIRNIQGVQVLDVSADPDHNRTVITFVGTPTAVEEAAFQAIAFAAQHINLDHHKGEHPRIGATDVCPFIPIKNVTMADCVAIAQRLGKRVGDELGIAVYLYSEAATRSSRKKLSSIRKGEYELWKEEVATKSSRQPDFGPAEPKTWGATVIGARPFLIAYNIYLNSSNVQIADEIARQVRFIGGGLRFVQAKGFLVENQAQISMNLTNFERTPIYRVQELVRREAARYGLTITKAELVGLTPQKALMEAAKWYLQLDDIQDNQVLEYQLAETQPAQTEETLENFIEKTAQATATPGGGAIAALVGALAAALTQMVAGLTTGRKKYASVRAEAGAILADARDLRQQLTTAVQQDIAAFDQVMAAWRLKEVDKETKDKAVEQATIHAAEVPLRVARLSLNVARLARMIAKIGNANAVTDAAAAAIMAQAAVQTAALNVKINAVSLEGNALTQTWEAELADLSHEMNTIVTAVHEIAAERGGF